MLEFRFLQYADENVMHQAFVGYGVIDPRTGDIPQIAVHKEHRGKGVGRSILSELAQLAESPRLAVLNVEAGDGLERCLTRMGFAYHVGQYEMMLSL